MTIRGTVTKTNSGAKPYSAYDQSGNFLGTFVSVRKAEEPIESAAGRRLKWTPEVAITGTERFIGEDP